MSKSTPKTKASGDTAETHDASIAPWHQLPLPRIPLVPEEILRRNNVYLREDNRFKAAARLLTFLWLKDHNIPTGIHVSGGTDDATIIELGSRLSPEAARAGKNFMSPAILALVRRELAMREEGALYDIDKLFMNALSSAPATFNVMGPLALDLKLATTVFRRLFPNFVQEVRSVLFEHHPGRRRDDDPYSTADIWLADRTAFDCAVQFVQPNGDEATIYVEMKLSETMTEPGSAERPRYLEASREVRLFKDPDSIRLRSSPLGQLWRESMLAQLAVDNGITPRAMFVVIAPRLNRRVRAAVKLFQNQLIHVDERDTNRVDFQALTLESIIDAMAEAGATEIARALWHRYADFQRILDLSLLEFDANPEFSTSTEAVIESKNDANQPKLPAASSDRRPLQSPSSARRAVGTGTGGSSRKPSSTTEGSC
jgi:hypothetical protein